MKKQLLSQSSISKDERRVLRNKERQLYDDLQEKENELVSLSSTCFTKSVDVANELYRQVVYPREVSLDAMNLEKFNKAIGKQASMLSASDLTKFDIALFVTKFKNYGSMEQSFDWAQIGHSVLGCSRQVPSSQFLFGSMDTEVEVKEVKKRRVRQKVVADQVEEARPMDFTNCNDNRNDVQSRRMKVMEDVVVKANKSVDLFRLTVHPECFAQTVENLFDVAFLIRDGVFALAIDDEGCPSIHIPSSEDANEALANSNGTIQSIMSFTPPEIQEIINTWQITTPPLVGHRN